MALVLVLNCVPDIILTLVFAGSNNAVVSSNLRKSNESSKVTCGFMLYCVIQ